MTIRETLEQREHEILSPFATKSDETRGRDRDEEPCRIRSHFQRDRDRILYSKSFRRLKDKTQVFLTPNGDHYRTRMTHSLEVAQNARTLARALRLNEDLAEAIALGHDLGHTPFGHAGERALRSVCPFGFAHNEQSLRIVEKLEREGRGLNLTFEVRDGILNHEMELRAKTLEGRIVRLSDKISYINADIDDAVRGGILKASDIPREYTEVLGQTFKERLNTVVVDIITMSEGKNDILMSEDVERSLWGLRSFLFDNVYKNPQAKGEETKACELVAWLFDFYCANPKEMTPLFQSWIDHEGLERTVADYVAGMTDEYAIRKYKEYTIPIDWQVL